MAGSPSRSISMTLTPKMQELRSAAPGSYPCFKESGFYKPTDNCRERCCVVPAKTPDGEDSPKWSATVAARMEHKVAIAQAASL